MLASPDGSLSNFNITPVGTPIASHQFESHLIRQGYDIEWWVPEAHNLAHVLANTKKLIRNIRQSEVNLVHLFLLNPSLAWIAGVIAEKTNSPMIITFSTHCHTGWKWLKNHVNTNFLEIRWYLFKYIAYHPAWIKLAKMLKTSEAYTVASNYQAAQLEKYGFPDKYLHVIPNMSRMERSETINISKRPPCKIGFIGHFTPSKGIDILLEAFEILASSRRDAELYIAWSGRGNGAEVKSAIKDSSFTDRIALLGKVELRQFFHELTVLCQPYRHLVGTQIYPNSLLEAMSANVPVITTNLEPLKELFGNNEALLVPPENPVALAEAIGKLCTNEQLRSKQQTAQHETASKFSSSKVTKAYHEIYQHIMENQVCGRKAASKLPKQNNKGL